MQAPRIFLSACEPSGDLHGAHIARQLLVKWPNCKLDGIGGSRMRALFTPSFDQADLAVMGFFDVLMALPRLSRKFWQIKRHLLNNRPDLIITIDYPVGHLLLMRHLKRCHLSSRWLHFVAPSMWVKGEKRLGILKKYADHLAVIFPREEELLRPHRLPCTFVGNPVERALRNELTNQIETTSSPKLIAIFPGSRLSEIERNLPLLLNIGRKLAASALIRISSSTEKSNTCPIQHLIGQIAGPGISLVFPKDTRQLMQECSLALAVSGTVCLELALLQVPTVVIYCLRTIDWIIARFILRLSLPFYSLPNLLAADAIFPEFFGKKLDESALLQSARNMLFEPRARDQCRVKCGQLRNKLAVPNKTSIVQIAESLVNAPQ